VKIIGERKIRKVRVPHESSLSELLRLVDRNRETVAVRLNGKIVAEEERLADGDLVEIIPIVTGG
jgi:sulfur carrier protein